MDSASLLQLLRGGGPPPSASSSVGGAPQTPPAPSPPSKQNVSQSAGVGIASLLSVLQGSSGGTNPSPAPGTGTGPTAAPRAQADQASPSSPSNGSKAPPDPSPSKPRDDHDYRTGQDPSPLRPTSDHSAPFPPSSSSPGDPSPSTASRPVQHRPGSRSKKAAPGSRTVSTTTAGGGSPRIGTGGAAGAQRTKGGEGASFGQVASNGVQLDSNANDTSAPLSTSQSNTPNSVRFVGANGDHRSAQGQASPVGAAPSPSRPPVQSQQPSVMDLLFGGYSRDRTDPLAPNASTNPTSSSNPSSAYASPRAQVPLSPHQTGPSSSSSASQQQQQQQPRGVMGSTWSASGGPLYPNPVEDDIYNAPELQNQHAQPTTGGSRSARSANPISPPQQPQTLPGAMPGGTAKGTTTSGNEGRELLDILHGYRSQPGGEPLGSPAAHPSGGGRRESAGATANEQQKGNRLLHTLMGRTSHESERRSDGSAPASARTSEDAGPGQGSPLNSPPGQGNYQSLGQALSKDQPGYGTPTLEYNRDPMGRSTASQDSAIDPDMHRLPPQGLESPPVPPAGTKPTATPFDYQSPFDMLRDSTGSNKSGKLVSSGSTATPATGPSSRPLPNPQVSGLRSSQASATQIPTSHTSTTTADTDFLSGSPAPGNMSSTPTSPAQGGGIPLVPQKAAGVVSGTSADRESSRDESGQSGVTGAAKDTAHARAASQSLETPESNLSEDDGIQAKYLAQGFVTRLREESAAPLDTSAGLTLRPSPAPQQLTISTHLPNQESLYISADPKEPFVLPIAIFPSPIAFSPGVKVAVNGLMTYATKAGRIRVIAQDSGAKMLLKKHEGRVVDMGIGQQRTQAAGRGGRPWRCLASVGVDGRLVIWKVPLRFDEDNATYEIFAEIQSEAGAHTAGQQGEHFTSLRWHPRDAAKLLVTTRDGRLIILRLDRGAFASAWKHGSPVPRSLTESEALADQDVLSLGLDIWATAWSPDGTAFAFVCDDNVLRVRQTSKPEWKVLEDRLSTEGPVTKLEFLSDAKARPQGFVIARAEGTKVDLVESPELSRPVASIAVQPPPRANEDAESIPPFGHVAWQQPDSTLLVSCSTRGSIFAFHVDFGARHSDVNGTAEGEDDVSFIERLAARRTNVRKGAVSPVITSLFIDHISEVPTPKPIISFNVDATRPAPGSSTCSVFCVNPIGISQIHIPREVMRPALAPPVIDTRRRSLAGEILVDVKVEKASEPVEPVIFTDAEPQSGSPATVEPDQTITLAKDALPSPRGPRGPRGIPSEPSADVKSTLSRELRSMEDSLHERLSRYVLTEIQKSEQRLEEERASHQAEMTAHQEAILKLVSTTLTKNTSKSLESTIRSEIKTTVLPTVSRLVETAVDEQFRRGLDDAMRKSIPTELEKVLFRPDVSNHLARSFSASVGPLIERNFGNAMTSTLVPAFTVSATNALQALVTELRGEITGVRKEIVAEQSNALTVAEQEIRELRTQVESMSRHMIGLQEVVKQLVTSLNTLGNASPQTISTGQSNVSGPYTNSDRTAPLPYPPHQGGGSGGYPQPTQQQQYQQQQPQPHQQQQPSYQSPQQAQQYQSPARNQTLPYQQQNQGRNDGGQAQKYASPRGAGAASGGGPMQDSPRTERGQQAPYAPTQQQQQQQQPSQLLNKIVGGGTNNGSRTPPSEYEDLFLRALSDKDPGVLGALIDEAPAHRLEAVFQRDGQWGRPALSQAVVLTLAHRLSEEVLANGQGGGPLSSYGTNRLRWIWSAVSAVDYKDTQTAQYLGRVLDLCSNCLLQRQSQLKAIGAYDDAKGISEVLRLIEDKTRQNA